MGTKKLDTKTRQKQIVVEALRIVSEGGLEELSMVKLGDRSGLVPSAVYRHFGSKEEIVDAVLDFLRERLFGLIDSVCQETSQAVDRLHGLLTRHVGLLRDNPGIPQVVFSEGVFSHDDRSRRKTRTIIEGYLERVAEIIRAGQESGQLRAGLDPKMLSVMFLGLILPAVMLSRVTSGEFDPMRHVENVWPLFAMTITGGSQT